MSPRDIVVPWQMKPLLCEIASYRSPSSGEVPTVRPERVLLVGDPTQSQKRMEYNYVYFFFGKGD